MGSVERDHARLTRQLAQLRACSSAVEFARRAEGVSGWSIGQQVEHAVMAHEVILGRLRALVDQPSKPAEGRASFAGRLTLMLGFIPRGRGRAPASVIPTAADAGEIRHRIDAVGEVLAQIGSRLDLVARATGTTAHPVLGHFNGRQWLRFTELHGRHHLKIVRDIAHAAAAGPTRS